MNRRTTWCARIALAHSFALPCVAFAQEPGPNGEEQKKTPPADVEPTTPAAESQGSAPEIRDVAPRVETTTPAAAQSAAPGASAVPEAQREVSAPAVLEASPYSPPPDAAELGKPQALTIYGFTDFGVNKFYTSDRSQLNALFPSRAGTFVLGNVNLFFDAEPYQDWRSLIEVRFTNLPHGYERTLASPLGDQYQREDTRVEDFTSPSIRGEATLGSVIIERAQTEYAFSDAFKIMGGYFFTPFG